MPTASVRRKGMSTASVRRKGISTASARRKGNVNNQCKKNRRCQQGGRKTDRKKGDTQKDRACKRDRNGL
jgi:hypothetical protein